MAESPQQPHDPLAKDFESQDRDGQGQRPPIEKDGRLFEAVSGRPVIRWKLGELPAIVDEAELALMESGLQIFQRDSPMTLVRVVRRQAASVRNYKRPAGVLGLVMVEPHFLSEQLTRAARWEKARKQGEDFVWAQINCPDEVVSKLMARSGQWRFPRLTGAISTPTLRPDGTLLQDPGYDAAMQVFYDPCGAEFPRIKESPDEVDAHAAFKVLKDAFGSFPYQDEVDRATALAAALTGVVRRRLPSAPLFGFSAPKPGSGKTLIADGISIMASGTRAPAMAFAKTDEEAQKTALSVLMQGDPVVLIDNVERPLEGDWLCSILTEETYSQRSLGRNEMVTVPTSVVFLATGNHLSVARDLRTRTLLCRLDAKMEHPEHRTFEGPEFRVQMLQDRPKLVAAALTLMLAFIKSGKKPKDLGLNPWGRFEAWSSLVRAPLVWMKCADPCASLATIEKSDPVRATQLELMALWWGAFGDKPMTAREVLRNVMESEGSDPLKHLGEALREFAVNRQGHFSARTLGRWLENHKDAPIGTDEPSGRAEYQIVRCGEKDNSAVWKVTRLGR